MLEGLRGGLMLPGVIIAVIATWFLLQQGRIYRPMGMVRAAAVAVLLVLLGGGTAESVGLGVLGGLLSEILNEVSGRRPHQ